jgi:subtilisin family serine protease
MSEPDPDFSARLIIEASAEGAAARAQIQRELRNRAAGLGYRYVAEMGEYLGLRRATISAAILPDVNLFLDGPQSQLGTGFSLTKTGCSHSTYKSHLQIPSGQGSISGSGVKVAVIDSGVEAGKLSTTFYDMLTAGNSNPVDGYGHGTAMVMIIADVATGAEIYAVRVTDNGKMYLWDVMAGISTAVFDVQADIINLSLGCKKVDKDCSVCGGKGSNRSLVFERFVDSMTQRSLNISGKEPVYVAAVGNDGGSGGFEWPARYMNVLAIGGITAHKQRASFSNTGTTKGNYVMCPGGEWDAAKQTVTEWVGEGSHNNNPTYCAGTSPATAYASAVMALYREQFAAQSLTANALMDEAFKRAQKDLQPTYTTSEHGAGRLVYS